MPTEIQHLHLLPPEWPSLSIALMSVIALLVWIGLHWIAGKSGENLSGILQVITFLIRSCVASTTLWLFVNVLNRFMVLATSWWIPGIAIFCGFAIELILFFYRFERRYVTGRLGKALAGLRIALVLGLGLMLLQPVLAWTTSHTQERSIAVLLDASQSMGISDQQLTDSEKLRLIRVFDESIANPPYELSESVRELTAVLKKMETVSESLEQIQKSESATKEFSITRLSTKKAIEENQKVLYSQALRIGDLLQTDIRLPGSAMQAASQLQDKLDEKVVARLVELNQLLEQDSPDVQPLMGKLVGLLQGAAIELREVLVQLPELIDTADRCFYASLPPEKRAAADRLVQQTRTQIARILLQGDSEREIPGLLEKLREGYSIRLFQFNQVCSELDLKEWQERLPEEKVSPVPGESPEASTENKTDPVDAQRTVDSQLTDIAGALARVESEIPLEQLAGVLLVTDGRHNSGTDAESMARKLNSNQVPVSALVLGSSRPPVDAAIVDVEHPQTVLVDDLLTVTTRVKLSGMKNRKVQAKLFEGDQELAERTIAVQSDNLTTSISLDYKPTEEMIGNYRVEVQPVDSDQIESEAFAANNSREISVAVTDDRTDILLVEGKTRWEFGYLRNLFAGRDETVRLQAVLLEPELLLGRDKPPTVHASASREKQDANALPVDESEWLKFDVIILGDIKPEALSQTQQESLYNFVNKRGGTLIVIAGQRNMPHRFGSTRLAELLPVEAESSEEIQFASPESEFNFRLSQIGRRHPIMRQDDSVEKSESIWNSIPPMYWRHAVRNVKSGASILAYAETEAVAPLLVVKENESTDEAQLRREKLEQYQREHALTVVQQFGLGRVLMMNTDRTWRLRYRVGDTYHHRLWGQILRWATSKRLQGGNDFIQVGTPKLTYEFNEPVVVSAKLTDSFFTPIDDPNAAIKVFQGEKLLFSKKLKKDPGNPGSWEAELGKFTEAGRFRIELESTVADQIFAGEKTGNIETEILVNRPEALSQELVEPTADRAGLTRLTSLAGGGMIEADARDDVLKFFAPGIQRYTETKSIRLWDTWPLLALMLTLLTVEWIFRKKGGLI